jgi:hypothetical protein
MVDALFGKVGAGTRDSALNGMHATAAKRSVSWVIFAMPEH